MGRPIQGTLAQAYLRGRGVTADLSGLPLRFHPACFYRAGEHGPRETRPALLAAVTALDGTITGVHRTWLDPAQATKAQLSTPRKAMGQLLGHAVRFGVAQPALAKAGVLAAGEGIETMLSLRTVLPTMSMVAALSANHLAALLLPAGLKRLYVAIDDDPAGRRAMEALRDREDLAAIEIREITPSEGDFNEVLRRQGAEALLERVKAHLAPEDEAWFVGEPRGVDGLSWRTAS